MRDYIYFIQYSHWTTHAHLSLQSIWCGKPIMGESIHYFQSQNSWIYTSGMSNSPGEFPNNSYSSLSLSSKLRDQFSLQNLNFNWRSASDGLFYSLGKEKLYFAHHLFFGFLRVILITCCSSKVTIFRISILLTLAQSWKWLHCSIVLDAQCCLQMKKLTLVLLATVL